MSLRDNREKLVMQSVMGRIHHPTVNSSGTLKTCHDGIARVLPSVGGITYNVKLGDCVFDKVCDHVEPGVSMSNPNDRENGALVMLACIGNEAKVVSGEARGAKGFVTGFHGGIEHTLLWFSAEDMENMLPEDRILIKSYGQGLALDDYPEIMLTGIDPVLLDKLNITERDGKIVVPVAGIIPSYLMGAGQGMGTGHTGDFDLMTADWDEIVKNGLDKLRYGDIVLLQNCDNSYGRGYLTGAVSIGVVVHSDCTIMGHGPGISTIMTCKKPLIEGVLDKGANLADYMGV
ncbi:MAG: DUF4438 domain-containing protein [Oscillospiraceae bacterium]|nr:DUF4438 domain-containing protein [Oscillospiraceae bacterium]MBP1557912.1 DUF4438 domain-containing protein [Oscillospiraceae bacterium]